MKVLVTGASGFVAGAVLSRWAQNPRYQIKATLRRKRSEIPHGVSLVEIDDLGPKTDWKAAVLGMDAVVHTAGRVHVMNEPASDPLGEFRRVNVEGTSNLACQAAAAGVRRFIFISSVKVNGEGSLSGRPFTETDPPNPQDAYGLSKWEAEQALMKVSRETKMEVVILRFPLVYGPRMKGNMPRLFRLADRGFPLPFRTVRNRRSLLYVGNAVSAISKSLSHPNAAGGTFMVSDGEPVSTPDLIRRIAFVLDRPVRLIPFPPFLLGSAGKLIGRSEEVDRLLGSLVIDSGKIGHVLNWSPSYTLDQGLKETASWYKKEIGEYETHL
jgi:nucleoside-diphosphate-sugar epimerase